MNKKIVLTGGGTGGHVIPALALVDELIKSNYEIHYIGSHTGIEKELVTSFKYPITYYPISTGKLRRYLSKENTKDVFRVIKGIGDATNHLKKIKPDIVFSKGGFVSVPVVIAAWNRHIPVIIHESDASFGLANKIAVPFAKAICTSFAEVKHKRTVLTGTPIRADLLTGDKEKARQFTGLTRDLPTIMVMGGSGGAIRINKAIIEALPELLPYFNIIHITGRGHMDKSIKKSGYIAYEFVKDQLKDLFAMSDIIVSRSGANAVFEFLSLKKPSLLIPLPLSASRGDQIDNAKSFGKQGFSKVLFEENLTKDTFVNHIKELYKNRDLYVHNMKKAKDNNAIENIIQVIKTHANKHKKNKK